MRVLLGQIPIVAGDVETNVATIAGAVERHADAELAAFPELALTGYDLGEATRQAVASGDSVFDPIRDAARAAGTAVVVGFSERLDDGAVANSAACIDTDGAWRGTYRKLQLFGDGEAGAFVAGDELLVVELAGRRVAPLICFDVEFPEPARAVAQAGAELLVTVAANMDPYAPEHALATAARAQDNHLPHAYVNQAGTHAGLTFVGQSAGVGPDGRVITTLGDSPTAATCDLPFDAPAPEVDYLRLLRDTRRVRTITAVPEEISS